MNVTPAATPDVLRMMSGAVGALSIVVPSASVRNKVKRYATLWLFPSQLPAPVET